MKAKRTDDELKEIALGMFENRLFCSDQIRVEDAALVPMVFLPVALMPMAEVEKLKEAKVQHLFAPLARAMGRSVNGYPCFAEMSTLDEGEYRRIRELLDAMRAAVRGVLSKETKP